MLFRSLLFYVTFFFATFSAIFFVPVSFANVAEAKAQFFCQTVLNLKSFSYSDSFSKEFQEKIPEPYFLQLISDLTSAIGTCSQTQFLKEESPYGVYKFSTARGRFAQLKLSVNSQDKIDGLLIDQVAFPDVVVDTFKKLDSHLDQLETNAAVTISNFTTARNEFQKKASEIQPIGSIFKLYVLGELVDQIHGGLKNWNQIVPIKEEWKSLPSGIMQTYPAGKEVDLKTYAEFMIKISDNTATDHLLHILGRENVESQLAVMGNDALLKNSPFLTTAEMFKIKWAAPVALINDYIGGDQTKKANYIQNEISALKLEDVGTNGVSMETPSYIHQIEWFASSDGICQALLKLKNKKSPEALEILSLNTPYLEIGKKTHWKYGGYKGGSEPGVKAMSYLLQSQSGNWGCVSIAFNSEKKDINLWESADLVSKILKLAETAIP